MWLWLCGPLIGLAPSASRPRPLAQWRAFLGASTPDTTTAPQVPRARAIPLSQPLRQELLQPGQTPRPHRLWALLPALLNTTEAPSSGSRTASPAAAGRGKVREPGNDREWTLHGGSVSRERQETMRRDRQSPSLSVPQGWFQGAPLSDSLDSVGFLSLLASHSPLPSGDYIPMRL